MSRTITKEVADDVFCRLSEILQAALGVEEDEVVLNANLIADLGMEEFDILDLVFRSEKVFGRPIILPRAVRFDFSEGEIGESMRSIPDAPMIRTVQDLQNVIMARLVSLGELSFEAHTLRFYLDINGQIGVALSLEDGSWCYADATERLPSGLAVVGLGSWTAILKELEELVNSPKTSEQDLQDFFEQNPELLQGEEYDLVIPQAVVCPAGIENAWRLDFVMRPIDQRGFVKVLELKKPFVSMTKKSPFSQNPFTAKLWDAMQQLRRYARAFQEPAVRDKFRQTYQVDVYRPDLHLIAGHRWELELADKFRDFIKDEKVLIESWEDMVDRLKRKFC